MQKEENHINKIEIANLARRQKKVSVCMITYNHEKFISQAIEGVLMQETDFDFELVIGEDFSTDTTRAICEQYANKYPEKIRLLPSSRNFGSMRNFMRTLNECRGEYIALCEGDDYWTDPLKLQKQVDILENSDRYNLCFHNVDVVNNTGVFIGKVYMEGRKKEISFTDLAKGDYTKTCSVVFKNTTLFKSFIQNQNYIHQDTTLFLTLLEDGTGYYLNETMAAYRLHEGGIWTGKNAFQRNKDGIINNRIIAEYYSNRKEKIYFKNEILRLIKGNFVICKNDKRYSKAFKYFLLYLFYTIKQKL